jgi:hypothetical protein
MLLLFAGAQSGYRQRQENARTPCQRLLKGQCHRTLLICTAKVKKGAAGEEEKERFTGSRHCSAGQWAMRERGGADGEFCWDAPWLDGRDYPDWQALDGGRTGQLGAAAGWAKPATNLAAPASGPLYLQYIYNARFYGKLSYQLDSRTLAVAERVFLRGPPPSKKKKNPSPNQCPAPPGLTA